MPPACLAQYTFVGDVMLPATFFVPATGITFTFHALTALQGFQVEVHYPTAKGFVGSADQVVCGTREPLFIKNDRDNGTLVLSVVDLVELTFPIEIGCDFDARVGVEIGVDDFAIAVVEVTAGNEVGDPASLWAEIALR